LPLPGTFRQHWQLTCSPSETAATSPKPTVERVETVK
jgi:hypothetical protein